MELIGAPEPSGPFSIGKYEVIKHLAAGGMAEVFLARTSGMLGFQKTVVIKRILPHLANRADFIEMFLDEARITTQLQHPNIVQTYEVGVANRSYFIAMEYLHGETVRSIMGELGAKNARLPVEFAVQIVSAIASGLHYAHERVDPEGRPLSIVHRDVTPQNIIVTFDGIVKLLDFGIAKAHNRMGETRAGTLKGKLPYMSPEQCRGEEMDHRSDIFSLGIMLYELTLTRRLFRGVSDFQILKQIVEGDVTPPRELDPNYPPALEEIVLHALRKPREERYQSARELLLDLEAFVRTERLPTSTMALGDFVSKLFHDRVAVPAVVDEHAGEGATGHSIEIEISAGPSSRTPSRGDVALDGPDIPTTPPFNLEFTDAGATVAASASKSISAAAPVQAEPAKRVSPWLVLAGASLIGVGIGGSMLVRRAIAPVPKIEVEVRHEEPIAPAPPVEKQVAAPIPVPPPAEPVPPVPKHAMAKTHSHAKKIAAVAVEKPAAKLEGEGTLVLATTPWCEVSIDKLAKGTTPLTTQLSAGVHTVVLTNAEFKVHRTVSVTILPDKTLRKRLDFDTP